MTRLLAAALLLSAGVGCSASAAERSSARAVDASPVEEQVVVDPFTGEQLLERIQRLAPDDREKLSQAMASLSVNCPYTRASLQLPIALHQVAAQLDPDDVDGAGKAVLHRLQHNLSAQVKGLDAMGIDLPLPAEGDHLHAASSLVDRAALERSVDPLAATVQLMNQNDALVEAMGSMDQELISGLTDVAYYRMGPTSMYHLTGGHLEALRRLAPHVVDARAGAQVAAMIALIELHESHGC